MLGAADWRVCEVRDVDADAVVDAAVSGGGRVGGGDGQRLDKARQSDWERKREQERERVRAQRDVWWRREGAALALQRFCRYF